MVKKLNILLSFHFERRQFLMLMPHFSEHHKQSVGHFGRVVKVCPMIKGWHDLRSRRFKSLVGVGMGSNPIGICRHILLAYPEANPYWLSVFLFQNVCANNCWIQQKVIGLWLIGLLATALQQNLESICFESFIVFTGKIPVLSCKWIKFSVYICCCKVTDH